MFNGIKIKRWKASELPPNWYKNLRTGEAADTYTVEEAAKTVVSDVKARGDAAVLEYTERFDKVTLTQATMRVTAEEIEAAYKMASNEEVSALKLMKNKLEALEEQTLQKQPASTTREGITVQTQLRPLESVGCYVPGGQAAYPSTLVMTATPARVAGVPRVVVCSPPTEKGSINPLILVAADICGVDEIYKVGGVQAIAALAYGTQTIQPVRKIVGPGSRYVTAAKLLVAQDVAIDMPAGPSEVLILADETAQPKFIAADMISQAEHGADSVAGLITTSLTLAADVVGCLMQMAEVAKRQETVVASLSRFGFIITCDKEEDMAALANAFAPEHVEIFTQKPDEVADKLSTAGLILLGAYSPVALSDYAAGTNHVLPTGGYGKAYSGLSVLDFVRRVSIVESTKEGLYKAKASIEALTWAEKLPNHYRAVEARFEE